MSGWTKFYLHYNSIMVSMENVNYSSNKEGLTAGTEIITIGENMDHQKLGNTLAKNMNERHKAQREKAPENKKLISDEEWDRLEKSPQPDAVSNKAQELIKNKDNANLKFFLNRRWYPEGEDLV